MPGTVAGLHLAWKTLGSKPWKDLVVPAVKLARDGFEISDGLARSLERHARRDSRNIPASLAQFSKNGVPYQAGEILKQPDLARTLERIADQGPAGFYEGETAMLLEKEMKANGGLITREDLKNYQAKQRAPIKGTYRGHEIIGMPPPSSGGISVQLMLNILEGYDLKANGYGSAQNLHLIAESMRRAFAERAQHLGDPDFVKTIPIERLISKEYAAELRKTINPARRRSRRRRHSPGPPSRPRPRIFRSSTRKRNAVAVTYTLEAGYGSKIVVPGAGFLLNNEMGDFNAGPGLTNEHGPDRHRAQPRAARQADAVEHVADDRRQGRQAVHGHRHRRAAAPSSIPC